MDVSLEKHFTMGCCKVRWDAICSVLPWSCKKNVQISFILHCGYFCYLETMNITRGLLLI